MLVEDEKKLRWWGLDMRPRGRRRNAVALTYAVFLAAVWWHPPRTFESLELMFFAGLLAPGWSAIEEATSKIISRALAGLGLVAGLAIFVVVPHPYAADLGIVDMWAFMVLSLMSVLGPRQLVETSGRGWLALSIMRGEQLGWRGQRRLARRGYAVGLDGFAWYEYGVRFKALTDAQKAEIQQMRRENPRGRWMRDRQTVLFDDERMRHEDDHVRATVQRVMSFLLQTTGWGLLVMYEIGERIPREWVLASVWTLAAFSVTLRQAIVLWTEEDPRAVSGELGVVRELEA